MRFCRSLIRFMILCLLMLLRVSIRFFLVKLFACLENGTLIIADNVLYKGYVMNDYNKHKQRTAVRALREYINIALDNPRLKSEILEVGDGICISTVL